MRARALAISAGVALVSSCAHVQSDTRIEKGPVLRTFDRERVEANAGVQATVDTSWPKLELAFSQFDRCHKEKVEESLEERITESSQPSAGPSLTLGMTTTVAAGVLLLGQGLFPDTPNTRLIDASGRYPPTSRQLARGWGIGLLIVGVPALAVGAWGLTQNGERSESRKVESVASATERLCNPKPTGGKLEFTSGKPPPAQPEHGRIELNADFLRTVDVNGMMLDGRPVTLDDEDQARLDSFRACLSVLPPPPAETIASMSTQVLQVQLDAAKACRGTQSAPVADLIAALQRELASRAPPPRTSSASVREQFDSFDHAKTTLSPKRSFTPDSNDLGVLDDADRIAGEPVSLRGVVGPKIDEDVHAFDVGPERIWLLLEKDAPWLKDVSEGTRLDVVGVVMGRDARPDHGSAPLVRAMWARPAM